jgi:hypothetical protein
MNNRIYRRRKGVVKRSNTMALFSNKERNREVHKQKLFDDVKTLINDLVNSDLTREEIHDAFFATGIVLDFATGQKIVTAQYVRKNAAEVAAVGATKPLERFA